MTQIEIFQTTGFTVECLIVDGDPCALWEGFWVFRSLALLVSGIKGSLVLWVSVVKGLWN